MHIPEQLFSLPLLKDTRTQPLERIVRRGDPILRPSATFQSPVLFRVPNDRIMCLTSYAATMTPDAIGGPPTSLGVGIDYPPLGGQVLVAGMALYGAPLASGQPVLAYGASVSIWLPPGSGIQIYGTFNSAANHIFVPSFTGLTFPRGSVSIG